MVLEAKSNVKKQQKSFVTWNIYICLLYFIFLIYKTGTVLFARIAKFFKFQPSLRFRKAMYPRVSWQIWRKLAEPWVTGLFDCYLNGARCHKGFQKRMHFYV